MLTMHYVFFLSLISKNRDAEPAQLLLNELLPSIGDSQNSQRHIRNTLSHGIKCVIILPYEALSSTLSSLLVISNMSVLQLLSIIAVSSACRNIPALSIISCIQFVNICYNRSPSVDPWETPHETAIGADIRPL